MLLPGSAGHNWIFFKQEQILVGSKVTVHMCITFGQRYTAEWVPEDTVAALVLFKHSIQMICQNTATMKCSIEMVFCASAAISWLGVHPHPEWPPPICS